MIDRIDPVLIHQIALFLTASECRGLALVSQHLRSAICSEELWKAHCLSQVRGFCGYSDEDLQRLTACLEIPTFYQLFCVTKNLSSDLVGYYSAVEGKVGLLVIRTPINPGTFLGLEGYDINSSGESHLLFRTKFNPTRCCLHAMNATGADLGRIDLGERLRMFIWESEVVQGSSIYKGAEFERIGPVISTTVSTVPCSLNYTSAVQQATAALTHHPLAGAVDSRVYSCLGFCTGVYGPHGREILYLSIKEAASSVHGDSAAENTSRLELSALKITGDPNVPAGNLSFVINLSERMNIAEEMERDERLIVVFGEFFGGNDHAVLAPQHRLPSLAAWYRGKGQINRFPGSWHPEWVDCSLWVYAQPLAPMGVRCTVVWDDIAEGFRHAIDFTELNTTIPDVALP